MRDVVTVYMPHKKTLTCMPQLGDGIDEMVDGESEFSRSTVIREAAKKHENGLNMTGGIKV